MLSTLLALSYKHRRTFPCFLFFLFSCVRPLSLVKNRQTNKLSEISQLPSFVCSLGGLGKNRSDSQRRFPANHSRAAQDPVFPSFCSHCRMASINNITSSDGYLRRLGVALELIRNRYYNSNLEDQMRQFHEKVTYAVHNRVHANDPTWSGWGGLRSTFFQGISLATYNYLSNTFVHYGAQQLPVLQVLYYIYGHSDSPPTESLIQS